LFVAQRGFAANTNGQTGQTVVFLGFCQWQGRVEKAPARRVFSQGPRLLAEAFRGPKALEDRRRKPIVCPTLAKNRRGAQRNEDLVLVVQAFVPVWSVYSIEKRLSDHFDPSPLENLSGRIDLQTRCRRIRSR